ncbi:hypothetical protein [Synechococcus sp. CS-1328]|uniref:hypothetical protein n=1 Tax=Synechococcus sp. CS-1328 TaxID=2847976 RepID=UPI00223BD8E3|nr:hypothetical protein [Synechococcus sp. CS-1328]MCT0224978.1 hypothetical protein [Synechococcus sp. CS-1328]
MTADVTADEQGLRPCRVRVVVPHYYHQGPGHIGYGSTRADSLLERQIALSRCLGGLLALNRAERDELLLIDLRAIGLTPGSTYPERRLSGVQVELHVFVTGDRCLAPVLKHYGRRIQVHQVELEDPRRLPHEARRFLLDSEPDADLYLYLEDDLVVADRLFVDKLLWFLERTGHQLALMPHRYELTGDPRMPRLFVDGPIALETLQRLGRAPQEGVAQGRFWDGQEVVFDLASNPHAGCFAVSGPQRQLLREQGVPDDGFVGPLETVATYTVLRHFPVVKPAWACRDFLLIEHGHPSFLIHRPVLPRV